MNFHGIDFTAKVHQIPKDNREIENLKSRRIVRIHGFYAPKPDRKHPYLVIWSLSGGTIYGDGQGILMAHGKLAASKIFIAEDYPIEIQNERQKLVLNSSLIVTLNVVVLRPP